MGFQFVEFLNKWYVPGSNISVFYTQTNYQTPEKELARER